MKVIISPRAEKEIKIISKLNQIIISKSIRSLPKTNDQQLKGYKNIYRTRIGDYRIVYKRTKYEVYIVLIGHRREIYKLLERMF
jgi:mRNA interferase RelE/StbE